MTLFPSNLCVHRRFILRSFTSRTSSSGGSGGSENLKGDKKVAPKEWQFLIERGKICVVFESLQTGVRTVHAFIQKWLPCTVSWIRPRPSP